MDNGGAGIITGAFAVDALIVNNIVVGNPPLAGGPGIFQFNDFYPSAGGVLSGPATNIVGTAGNISANPHLVCQPGQDYHLLPGSPCIDAGTNGAEIVLGSDFDGEPRIVAGNTNGSATVDLGAFEFQQGKPAACVFLFCPSNMLTIAPAGQTSMVVNYPAPYATPGATLSNWPPSGSVFPAGDDSVSIAMNYGSNVLSCGFMVSVLTTDDFARGLNATNLSWTSSGDARWFVQSAVTRDGLAAAQSGAITDNQSSVLTAAMPGPGTLNFWWKVSSEANHDLVTVSVNGVVAAAISGSTDWRQQTVYLGAGPQTVQWTYSKDASGSAGQDAGWLDLVSYMPGATAPMFLSQPASVAVARGQTGTFSASVVGTPPLGFQWRFNGTNLPGETGAMLAITNVQDASLGRYTLAATNSAGATNSTPVTLQLARVVAWGGNSYGQTNVPLSVTNVLAIAGGYHHSVVLTADRKLVGWGANNAGQTNVPTGLTNAVAIGSRSGDYSMALKPDGTVVVWGDNSDGQRNIPSGLSNVVGIATGGSHWLAVKADGNVVACGWPSTVPAGISNAVAAAAGDNGSAVLRSDGSVVGWGLPAGPTGLSDVVAVGVGFLHGIALRNDGTVFCWGDNSHGQTNVPAGLSNVVAIAAGDNHSSALRADGTVATWGQYQTGSGMIPAVAIPGLSNVVAIAAGSDHDMALLGDGPPILQASPSNIRWTGNNFGLVIPTQSGRIYRLEYRNSLSDTNWSALPLVYGNGVTQTLQDTNATTMQRFYRVRCW